MLAMGTITATDKATTSNPFLSLLGFQTEISLSPLSDNKDFLGVENIKCVVRATER